MRIIKGYVEVDINKIKPDPDQPRKYFDPEVISALAATIKSNLKDGKTGLVNSIEIDEDHVIVTGETRWRGAKEAGESTVPCKIIEISKDERFFRQVVENLARGSMAPLEYANALHKLLIKMGWKPSEPGSHGKGQDRVDSGKYTGGEYVSKLAKKMGKTTRWVYQMLELLDESPDVKEYLKQKEAKYSLIREINQSAPEDVKETLKNKVLNGSLPDRETTSELIRALKWSPEKQKELLETNFNGDRSPQNILKIHEIAPEPGVTEKDIKINQGISKHLMRLAILLKQADFSKTPATQRQNIIDTCYKLIERLNQIIDDLSDRLMNSLPA